ncbi:sortase [Candidatus Kaiserbacteria bacterium]|nr:sortase [Candidatus Kaiserbacteria bacterium]
MNSHDFNPKQAITTMLALSVLMFVLTFSAFYSIGFVPSYIDGVYPAGSESLVATTKAASQVALSSLPQLGSILPAPEATKAPAIEPERIAIHSIGLDLPVLNPTDTNVEVLDRELLSGTVRYPLSAKLNENGNVFIFGHSSRIAFVKNPMFKAFNRISELREGDTINVSGDGQAFIYRVTNVRRTDASEAIIDLSPSQGKHLTLSTCDSFTSKSARFVVEADLIGSYKDE